MFTYLHKARNAFARIQQRPSHSSLCCSVAQRKAAAMAFSAVSVEQRAVGLNWLSRSGRKELDFVLLGGERPLQIREDPPSHKKKKKTTKQSKDFRAFLKCAVDLTWQHQSSDRVHQYSSAGWKTVCLRSLKAQ